MGTMILPTEMINQKRDITSKLTKWCTMYSNHRDSGQPQIRMVGPGATQLRMHETCKWHMQQMQSIRQKENGSTQIASFQETYASAKMLCLNSTKAKPLLFPVCLFLGRWHSLTGPNFSKSCLRAAVSEKPCQHSNASQGVT